MENKNAKLSIVVPVFNEAGVVAEFYRRTKQILERDFKDFEYEIIFVDDGSQDDTFRLVQDIHQKDGNVKIIQFSRNFGHHIALTAGLDEAAGDFIVTMDGDLQDQPEEIINLYKKMKGGDFDVVYAERINKKFNFAKKLSSSIFNFMIRKLIDEKIVINSTIFRIMTRQAVENIKKLRERNRYIIGIIGWAGFKHASQKVEHGARYEGKSKYNFSKSFLLALNAIFAFSTYPLRLTVRLGLVFVSASFLIALYIIYEKIVYGTPVAGWTSLILAIITIGGIQLIVLGIIGEYIGRIYIESKGRPLYVIKKKIW